MKIVSVVLAAGKSTRMKSCLPKVLQMVCGRPLLAYPIDTALSAGAARVIAVISPEFEDNFKKIFADTIDMAIQQKQLGTGDAVKASYKLIGKGTDSVLIIPGDVPLIKTETLKKFISDTVSKEARLGILTMEMDDPQSYGRIIRGSDGSVKAIVEAKDATPDQLMVHEVNSGIYLAEIPWLFEALARVTNENAQKEYYLTDIVGIAVKEKMNVSAFCIGNPLEVMGVNTRKELSVANQLMQERIADTLMENGVGIMNKSSAYIDHGVVIGADTSVAPNTYISGKTRIGKNCIIDTGVCIKDSEIGDDVHIKPYSVIEGACVKNDVEIGPFARLRHGTVIEETARIGNFVEIKKSQIKKGAKANHLSYIGDAVIGERTNVGCGTVTCNYDGLKKHKTVIGNDVFIGSAVQFVAPITIGDNALIGAGSTITEDVPADSLAIARGRQVIKKKKL